MKKALLVLGMAVLPIHQVHAGDYGGYDSSPFNYDNSEYNFENSPYNYKNSPYNHENSRYNQNATNGIYNEDGERIGYGVRREDGGINFYNNDGDRVGYQPGL